MAAAPEADNPRSPRERMALGICGEVAMKVTPSEQERERVLSLAQRLAQATDARRAEVSLDGRVEILGSVAKDTWLSGEADVDLFLIVAIGIPRETMVTKALQVGRQVVERFEGRWIERYAEHPYVEGYVEGTRVNLVPCYAVKDKAWLTAVDRTPHHTQYVKQRLADEAKREVRLLKRFMKGIGVYGADIKVGGFSGYLCELLVIRFSSFLEVLKAAARWRLGASVAVQNQGDPARRQHEVPSEPLVVADPVDLGRNVASAVSTQRMSEFIAASRAFLQQPTMSFFYPPVARGPDFSRLMEALEARGPDLVVLSFGRVNAVPDVLWGQMHRSLRALVRLLEKHDFSVLRASPWSNEKDLNAFTFELEQANLPPASLHRGPPVVAPEAKSFLRKHLGSPKTVAGPWIGDDRWLVVTKRRETDVVAFLNAKLSRSPRGIGVRGRIQEALERGYRLYARGEIAELSKADTGYAAFLSDFLSGRPAWLEP